MSKFKFISLEGISGSGKTELSKLLTLEMQGVYYCTPPEAFRPSRKYIDEVATLEARYMFYLAAVTQASAEISELLKSGNVICDKYIATTICYHRAFGLNVEMPRDKKILQPDHTLLIWCEDAVRLRRLRISRGPVIDPERYEKTQQLERRSLVEYRKLVRDEVNNTPEGPHHALNKILRLIRR